MDWIKDFAQMAEGRATRKTALQPLLWLVGTLATSLAISASFKSPTWLLVVLVVLLSVAVTVLLGAFCVFAVKHPDLLRSESYIIRRMELERSSIGDSVRGLEPSIREDAKPELIAPEQEGGA